MALSPVFLPVNQGLRNKRSYQLLAPIIITIDQTDRTRAHTALEADAFDIIVKPIVPHDAARTVQLALWQSKLLRLLASKERTVSRFQDHMATFPHDQTTEDGFVKLMDIIHQTLQTSFQLLQGIKQESMLFDLASNVERLAKQRALARILNLCQNGRTQ